MLGKIKITIVAEFDVEDLAVLADVNDCIQEAKYYLEIPGYIKSYVEEFLPNKENE